MGTFLKMLNLEVGAIEVKDFYEPDIDPQPGDEKVGELNEDLIRLFTYWKINEKAAEEKLTEAKFFRGMPADKKVLLDKAIELNTKADILERIFWMEVRQDIHLWDKQNLGIRRGRQIVLFRPKPQLPQMFGPFQIQPPE